MFASRGLPDLIEPEGASLRRTGLRPRLLAVLQHACVEPLLDVAQDALVGDPVFDEFQ
jgi:hypothetical protein